MVEFSVVDVSVSVEFFDCEVCGAVYDVFEVCFELLFSEICAVSELTLSTEFSVFSETVSELSVELSFDDTVVFVEL